MGIKNKLIIDNELIFKLGAEKSFDNNIINK